MNRNYLRPLFALALLVSGVRVDAQLSVTNPALPTAVSSLNSVNFISAPTTASNSTSEFLAVGTNNQVASWTFTNVFLATNLVANQFNNWTNLNIPASLLSVPNTLSTVAASPAAFFVSGQSNRVFGLASGTTNWLSIGTNSTFANTAYAAGLAYNNSNGVLVEVAEAPEIAWLGASSAAAITNTWTNANGSFSFADSFRAVTAYSFTNRPTTNFAACGIFGALYASTNGGVSWIGGLNPNANVSQSPFYGMASDSQNTLVCVGGAGSVSVFTNSTASILSLEKVVTNIPSSDTFLSVAYLGATNGFVAVGTDSTGAGIAWQSLNGTTWSNLLTANPHFVGGTNRAIAYASGGYLQGVGVIVGNGGHLQLFADAPAAPTNATPVGQTNFVGQTAFPIVASVASGYPIGTETVDWFDSNTNPIAYDPPPTSGSGPLVNGWSRLANGYSYFYPPIATNNVTTNYIYYARSRDLRTGFVSTNYVPVFLAVANAVYKEPTATVFGTTNICNGQTTTVYATLAGTPPFTVTWQETWPGHAESFTTNYPTANASLTIETEGQFMVTNTLADVFTNYTVTITNLTDLIFTNNINTNVYLDPLQGQAVVTVNPRPAASLLSFISTDCNEGPAYTLTNLLSGLGPWTVLWNDGYMQTTNASYGNSAYLVRTVYPTNGFAANTLSNNIFYVVAISNADTCLGNEPGDIIGAVTNIINPRPTASLLSFVSTDCNEGPVYTLTNTLTGIGPWTVTWNDGFQQTVPAQGAGPALLKRTVNPTNSFGADVVSNNVFYVTGVVDGTGCAGDKPGDITGAVTNIINPRPTASLLPFVSTDCNEGRSYTLTNTISGLGPWTVLWNDGYLQTTNTAPGSSATLVRTVNPSVGFGANVASNNVFYVTYVSDGTSCVADKPGDITGSVTNIINPRPTASLLPFISTDCNEGRSYILTNTLTGLGPWTVLWNDGSSQTTNAASGSSVILVRTVYPTNFFGVNGASNNVYYVTNIVDGTSCSGDQAGDIIGSVTNIINPRPTASLLSFVSTDCNEGQSYILTNTLTGLGPWTVKWNDGTTQTTNMAAGSPVFLVRTVYPTNFFGVNGASNNVYYVTNIVDGTSCSGDQAGDIIGSVTNIINPRPTASLLSFASTDCNEGRSYILTNTLTGLGPWTVLWNDGSSQTTNAASGSSVILVRTVYPTNFFGVNGASNNVYYVTNIVDGTSCSGDQAGDIIGSVTNIINPRPTASLLSFVSTDCNEGRSYILTNTLTGLGPWTVKWNDGTTQTTNMAAGSPVFLVRTVYPTNFFGVNGASNNVYYVTNIVDGTSCVGDQAGDITGSVTNIINPRPTASLLSFISTDCNEGRSYILTNTLTGLGPWTVLWNDGSVQTTNAASGNSVVLVRTVYPTNAFGANVASNNVYYVASIADGTSCSGDHPGDIIGSVTNIINPRPTASLLPFASTDCNEGRSYVLTNTLTGLGPWTVKWNDGTTQTTNMAVGSPVFLVRTVYPTNFFGVNAASNNVYYVTNIVDGTSCIGDQPGDIIGSVTNTINPRPTALLLSFISTNCNYGPVYTLTNALTGLGPWTVQWNDGTTQMTNTTPGSPAILVRTVYSTNLLGANLASNNVYYVTNIVDGTTCAADQAGDIRGAVTNIINQFPGTPLAPATLVGEVTNSIGDIYETNVIGGTVALSVAVPASVTANWYDWTQTNVLTNSSTIYLPTNGIAGIYTNYAQAWNTNTGCLSTSLARVILVLIPPAPVNSGGNQTNCAGVINPPLVVTLQVPVDGGSVNWYADAAGTIIEPGGTATNSFTPTNTAVGTFTFYAQTFAHGLASTNLTPVGLTLQSCTGAPMILSLGVPPTNSIVSWYGNLLLESTTNLGTSPIIWITNSVGLPGATNFWTNTIPLPDQFFRLYAPTN